MNTNTDDNTADHWSAEVVESNIFGNLINTSNIGALINIFSGHLV